MRTPRFLTQALAGLIVQFVDNAELTTMATCYHILVTTSHYQLIHILVLPAFDNMLFISQE